MADEILGHGRIVVSVEQDVARELRKAEAEFDRTMARLDRKKAELTLDADASQFHDKLRKAQADLEKWKTAKADATLGVDTKQANAGIANATQRLKRYESENVKLFNRIAQLDDDRAKAQEALNEKRLAGERKVTDAVAREEAKRAAAAERESNARTALIAKEDKARETERIKREREEARTEAKITRIHERESERRLRDEAKAASETEKLMDKASANMRRSIQLQEKRQRLENSSTKIFQTPLTREKIKLDLEINAVDLAKVHAELAAIGHPPPHVSLDIDQSGTESIAKFIDAITNTTVRLGPFTTTIAGAGRALAILGPIIVGVVGALGALVSVVGAAAIGFGGLALGGLGAFGLVLGTTALLIPPMLDGLKDLNTLQNAYQREVLKSGEGSKKAKEALKQYNEALNRAPKTTREAVKGWGEIKSAWRDLAKESQPAFMKTLSEGVKTGKSLIKDLGPEVTQSFDLVAKGVQGVFKGLRSETAKGIFKDLFDSGQKAMPAFGRGLGNIAEAAGRIAAAFAKIALPKAGKGFESWTEGILNFAKDGDKVSKMVKTTTGALSSLGHFLQASTKFLVAFFAQGVGPGIGLLDDLTGGLDGLTDSINNNPQGLQEFFGNSVHTAELLFSAIKPISQIFIEWSTIMRPISDAALVLLGALLKVSSAVFGLGATKNILVAAFGLFLAGAAAGKVLAFAKALMVLRAAMVAIGATKFFQGAGFVALNALLAGFPAKIRAIRAASSAAAAASAATSVMPMVGRGAAKPAVRTAEKVGISAAETAGIAAVGSKASKATGEISLMRAGVVALGSTFGITSLAGSTLATGGLALVGAAAVYGGYKLLTMKSASEKLNDALKESEVASKNLVITTDAHSKAVVTMGNATRDYRENIGKVSELKKQLNALEKNGGKDTAAYKAKLDELNQALLTRGQNENLRDRAQQAALKSDAQAQSASVKARQSGDILAKTLENQRDKQDRYNEAVDLYGSTSAEARRAQLELSDSISETAKAQAEYNRFTAAASHADRQKLVDNLNYQRALQGLIPIAGKAGTAIAALAKRAPNMSQTIALKYADPKDAGAVAARASAALKSGVKGNIVLKIIADSKNADEAIRRLRAVTLTAKEQKIITSGGKAALSMLESLIGRKLTTKEQKIAQAGGPAVLAMLAKILGVRIPPKTAKVTVIADSAMAAIQRILTGMGQLSNKSVYIDTYYRTHGRATPGGNTGTGMGGPSGHGAMGGVFAMGGNPTHSESQGYTPANKPHLPGIINWAANKASPNTKSTKGGKYSRPTYLVGEENRNEYVIATNPAYKERNVAFLAQAAQALGFDITPKSKDSLAQNGKQVRNNTQQTGTIIAAAAGYANANPTTGYNPSLSVDKAPASPGKTPKKIKRSAKKFRNKRTAALKSGRDWAHYIEGLETQQGDIEREISIRSSQVEEPSSLTKEVGRIIVDAPNADGKGTHKEDLGPQLAPDTEAIESYKAGLRSVQEAIDALVRVIQAIIVGIPKALTAIATEDAFRRSNIVSVKDAIERDEKIVKNRKKGKVSKEDKEIIARAEGRLKDNNDRLKHERKQREVIKEDKTSLTGNIKEAGFDLREAIISQSSNKADLLGIDKKASDEADTNNNAHIDPHAGDPAFTDPSEGGSGGSGGSNGPTLAQQTGLADTERANILKQYGGNMGAVTANGAAGAATGGLQVNVAGSNPMGSIGSAIANGAGSGITLGSGGGVTSAMTNSAFAAPSATPFTGSSSPSGMFGTNTGKTINITNNFQEPPPDPHSWSAGVGFETNALV